MMEIEEGHAVYTCHNLTCFHFRAQSISGRLVALHNFGEAGVP